GRSSRRACAGVAVGDGRAGQGPRQEDAPCVRRGGVRAGLVGERGVDLDLGRPGEEVLDPATEARQVRRAPVEVERLLRAVLLVEEERRGPPVSGVSNLMTLALPGISVPV